MRALIASLVLATPSMAFASEKNINSVLVGMLFVLGMASCVLLGYFRFNQLKRKKSEKNRLIRQEISSLGPIIKFELRFVLFLRSVDGNYLLPNGRSIGKITHDVHEQVRACFMANPNLFEIEKQAGRLFKSHKEIVVAPERFQIMINFSFHYQPQLDPVDRKMISLHQIKDLGYYKTSDLVKLISSVKSSLKSNLSLIPSEVNTGRLKMVKNSQDI
ncbi:MAG: hypothetical protein WCG01_01040 [bacterium]